MQKVSNGHRITFIWEYGEALVAQRKQADDKSAHEEAFKLAEVHPGRKVYLLEAKEYCIQESQPVIWREVK